MMTSQNRLELEPSHFTETSARAENDFPNVTRPGQKLVKRGPAQGA